MRCAIWTGGRDVRIEVRPPPVPGEDQVRVRVHAGALVDAVEGGTPFIGLHAATVAFKHQLRVRVENPNRKNWERVDPGWPRSPPGLTEAQHR